MNKSKIVKKIIILLISLTIGSTFMTKGVKATTCEDVQNVEYITATMTDLNDIIFNEKTRGETFYDYITSPNEHISEIDKSNVLLATGTYKVMDGVQNGFYELNKRINTYSALQGIVQSKLCNGNILYSSKYNNKYTLFPTANAKTGEDEIYTEILNNWKFPIIKNSDSYSFDSASYHVVRNNSTKTFELHKGTKLGFYPFHACDEEASFDDDNLYFSAKLEIPFIMSSDGQVKHEDFSNMYFNISGGDDIWVFIDDSLVIDLGGTHRTVSANLDFVNNNVTYSSLYNESTGYSSYNVSKKVFNEKLSEGKHTLKIFYAQRGFIDNSLNIKHNLENGSIKINYIDNKTEETIKSKTIVGRKDQTLDANEITIDGYSLINTENLKFDSVASEINVYCEKEQEEQKNEENEQENSENKAEEIQEKNEQKNSETKEEIKENKNENSKEESTIIEEVTTEKIKPTEKNSSVSSKKTTNKIEETVSTNTDVTTKEAKSPTFAVTSPKEISKTRKVEFSPNDEDSTNLNEKQEQTSDVEVSPASYTSLDTDLVTISKSEINKLTIMYLCLTGIVIILQLAILLKK